MIDSFLIQPVLISPNDESDFNSQLSQPFFLKNIQRQLDSKAERSNKVGHFGTFENVDEIP